MFFFFFAFFFLVRYYVRFFFVYNRVIPRKNGNLRLRIGCLLHKCLFVRFPVVSVCPQ